MLTIQGYQVGRRAARVTAHRVNKQFTRLAERTTATAAVKVLLLADSDSTVLRKKSYLLRRLFSRMSNVLLPTCVELFADPVAAAALARRRGGLDPARERGVDAAAGRGGVLLAVRRLLHLVDLLLGRHSTRLRSEGFPKFTQHRVARFGDIK